jgi:hypothetical protein
MAIPYAGDILAGDLKHDSVGCIGFHYSANWFDGDSNSGALAWRRRPNASRKRLEDQMAFGRLAD